MNLNLIIDEEAFFAVFGRQSILGSIQPDLAQLDRAPAPSSLTASGQLSALRDAAVDREQQRNPPIPLGGPPVPLVVSAIQPTGAPNYVYPITDQTQSIQHGYLATDPIGVQYQPRGRASHGPTRRSATGSRRRSRSSSGCATAARATCSATAPAVTGQNSAVGNADPDVTMATPGRSPPSARSTRSRIPTSTTRSCGPPRCRRRSISNPAMIPNRQRRRCSRR